MGNNSAKILPQSQRVVATHLSAAKESEKAAQALREDFNRTYGGMERGKYHALSNPEQEPGIEANMHSLAAELEGVCAQPLPNARFRANTRFGLDIKERLRRWSREAGAFDSAPIAVVPWRASSLIITPAPQAGSGLVLGALERRNFSRVVGRVNQSTRLMPATFTLCAGVITHIPDKRVMPEGAYNPNGKRKLAGKGHASSAPKVPLVGADMP
jgi:hypothetical protein